MTLTPEIKALLDDAQAEIQSLTARAQQAEAQLTTAQQEIAALRKVLTARYLYEETVEIKKVGDKGLFEDLLQAEHELAALAPKAATPPSSP